MALVQLTTTSTLSRNLANAGTEQFSRPCVVEARSVPDKVKGSVVKFDDGTLFRRATPYAKSSGKLEFGPAQFTQGKTTALWPPVGRGVFISSSPGGFRADRVFDAFTDKPLKGGLGMTNLHTAPTIPTSMSNEAVTKSLLDLADQKANIGETLATLRQTLNLIDAPARSLIKGIRKVYSDKSLAPFMRQSVRDALRGGMLRYQAEEYLKYVYGWKPLMQDIYGAIEFSKQLGKTPLLMHSTGVSRQQTQSNAFVFKDISNDTSTEVGAMSINAATRCSIWARVDPEHQGLRSLNQLGLLNPLSLAWELVPGSFIVDWVLPIGPMLNALSAPAGLKFVDGSISNRVTANGTYRHRYDALYVSKYKIDSDVAAGGNVSYEGYKRTTLSNWPLPGLWIDQDPLRGDRWMKALALTIISMRSLR